MRVAVLGAGHGGTAAAAHLSKMGHEVRLFDKFREVVEPFGVAGSVTLKGVLGEGVYPIEGAYDRLNEAMRGARLVLVVTPAFAHREIATHMADSLEDGQIILLHPGRTGGALEFRNVLKEKNCGARVFVAEAQTLLYACRKSGPTEVHVMGVKRRVRVAALPAEDTARVLETVSTVFPQFVAAVDVLETSLLNIGAMFHPAPTLLNAGRIEDTKGDFRYYHQGITPGVARVIEMVDEERVRIASSLGVPAISAMDWLMEAYGVKGSSLYECVQGNAAYAAVKAPGDLNARYLSEDVPTGLVPLAALGRIAGVRTPVMDALIDLASSLHARDYRSQGRNEAAMGIAGLSKEGLLRMVREECGTR